MASQATQRHDPHVARRHWTTLFALAFTFSTIGIGTAGLTAPPAKAASAVIVVPDDAATIAAALALVDSGGTVHVNAGTYAGGFVIDRPVTLEGEGWDATLIDGTSVLGDAVTIQGTGGVTIRDLKVRETPPDIGIHLISAGGNTLDHVWTDGGRFGVSFSSAANDNLVVDSRASNAVEWAFEGGDTASSGNTYRRVEAWGSAGGIVAYAGSNGTTVEASNLHDNGVGFQIGWSSGWSITGSTLSGNGIGVSLDTTWGGLIANNEISGSSTAGVYFGGLATSGTTVSGNRITDNGGTGVLFASGSSSNTIIANEIRDNSVGVRVTRNESLPNFGNHIFHNRLIDNGTNAIADEERSGGNSWDDGYPSGGNFWYDFFAVDAMQGPAQDQPGADGIIDIARPIVGASSAADLDHYPLVVGEAPYARIGGWHFNPATGHYYAQVDGRTFAYLDSLDSNPTAHLVTINDQAEQDWLSATFTDPELVIGLNDLAEEGTWVWTSGEPVSYTNWALDEPNSGNLDIGGEDVAVMNWPDPNRPGLLAWNDLPNIGWRSGIIETATPSTGGISGTVRSGDATPRPGGGEPLQPGDPMPWIQALVLAWDAGTGEWTYVQEATSADDGTYEITELAPGDYLVRFTCNYPDCEFDTQYWNGVDATDAAARVTVAAGLSVTGIDAVMHRIQGPSAAAFTVNPGSAWISGRDFAPGAAVTIRHGETPIDGGNVGADEDGNFWFEDDAVSAIQAGDTISVSDGTTTKTTVVTGLRVTSVVDNLITGWAESGPVGLNVWNTDVNRNVAIDAGGSWLVNVSVPGNEDWEQATTTIGPGSGFGAWETDADGDATQLDWQIPNPRITVNVRDVWIQGEEFAPGSTITITVNGHAVSGDPIIADDSGWFIFEGFDSSLGVTTGADIVASDGTTSKETTVTGLRIDRIDGNVVRGWAEAGPVNLDVWDTDVYRTLDVGTDGSWSADVSVAGREGENATTTLEPGDGVGVRETDPDGDATHATKRIPNPQFYAVLSDNRVSGYDFGGPVVIGISDPSGSSDTWSGAEVGYDDGWFDLGLGDQTHRWVLRPGQTVTVTSDQVTRSLLVANLRITRYDLDANTIVGTTDQTGQIQIDAGRDDDWSSVGAALSNGGVWSADFDLADPPFDLQPLQELKVQQRDADGDATVVSVYVPGLPRFAVGPTLQEIVGVDWPDGATVTLTIDRPTLPGNVDFTASVTAGSGCDAQDTCFNGQMPLTGDGNVYFNLTTGQFWVIAGDLVTMTDDTTTKTQVIPDLQPGLGDADMNVTDEDGDSTFVPAPTPGVILEPATDRVWAGNFAKGPVTLTIERPAGTVVHNQTVQTQNVLTRGSWNLDMWAQPVGNLDRPTMALFNLGAFDLQAGDIVTVTDGVSRDRSVVADLSVDGISADTDTISGHAGDVVIIHLGEGEGGYWGDLYQVTPGAGAAWSLVFTPGVFPNPPDGLSVGMTGQAIIDNTVVRWKVAEAVEATVVTADDQTAVYGAPLPPLTWAATEDDVVWTAEPDCATTASVGSAVGTYAITCDGAVASGYGVTYLPGTLTITPAALTVKAMDATRVYGADNPVFEFTADYPVDDTLTTPPTCATTALPGSKVGTYPITCTGAADDNYVISYLGGTLTVTKAPQTIAFGPLPDRSMGDPPLTLIATASSGLPVSLTSATPTVCKFTGWKLDKLSLLKPGTCTITATQGGSKSYLAAAPVSHGFLVLGAASSTKLSASRATSVFGQAVTFTATVTGSAGRPTGSVTFMDGTTALGTRSLDRGTASITTKALGVGNHVISAVYGGSATYVGSTGTLPGAVVVAKGATDITITNAWSLSRTTTRPGQAYEISVRVSTIQPGSGTPTGAVTVSDGTVSCTITLAADGTGHCSLTSTSEGTKTITATYLGNASYLPDTATTTHRVHR